MLFPPNRVMQARELLEKGEPVDPKRLALLQALDLVIVGREFVEDAIRRHEEADEAFRPLA